LKCTGRSVRLSPCQKAISGVTRIFVSTPSPAAGLELASINHEWMVPVLLQC
jgi:hypothetical protein